MADTFTNTSPYADFLDPTKMANLPLVPGQPPPAGAGSTTMPASFGGPLPAGQTPPPSVNAQVVYTDQSGKGYDPAALAAALQDPTFANNPANARAGDIVSQYRTSGAGMTPAAAAPPAPAAPAGGSTINTANGYQRTPGLTPSGLNDPASSAFYQQLLSRIDAVPDVSNDPVIQKETEAYRAEQERSARNIESMAAEAKGPYGATGSSGVSSEARLAEERAGQATGAFEGQLMNQERQARRSQIQNMLSLGGSFLTNEQQIALAQELNDINSQNQLYEFNTNTQLATSPFAAGMTA